MHHERVAGAQKHTSFKVLHTHIHFVHLKVLYTVHKTVRHFKSKAYYLEEQKNNGSKIFDFPGLQGFFPAHPGIFSALPGSYMPS